VRRCLRSSGHGGKKQSALFYPVERQRPSGSVKRFPSARVNFYSELGDPSLWARPRRSGFPPHRGDRGGLRRPSWARPRRPRIVVGPGSALPPPRYLAARPLIACQDPLFVGCFSVVVYTNPNRKVVCGQTPRSVSQLKGRAIGICARKPRAAIPLVDVPGYRTSRIGRPHRGGVESASLGISSDRSNQRAPRDSWRASKSQWGMLEVARRNRIPQTIGKC